MYKLLLCWRYLRTRYLALACVVSVMLGVATLIVVNSVMSGFSTKLRDRLHALLSDIVIETQDLRGFADPEGKMARIMSDPFLKEHIVAMAPSMEIFAIIKYDAGIWGPRTRTVRVVGVDPKSRSRIGGFKEHLVLANQNHTEPSFELSAEAKRRYEMREKLQSDIREMERLQKERERLAAADGPSLPAPTPFPAIKDLKTPRGAIVGHLIATMRPRDPETKKVKDFTVLDYGDEIEVITIGGQKPNPVQDRFVVVDQFKSEMSEYDNNFVYVPLDHLQHLRTMEDRVTTIHISIKDFSVAKEVKERLQYMFELDGLHVNTWEDLQGALLSAISIEKGILNILLFLIVAVAGFGILAIFTMIVSEKTRDIGILKALGASNGGVMKIFMGYGLLLGVVGSVLGSSLGLSLAIWINNVEQFLTQLTGQEVFNRETYYFKEIPIDIQPGMVVMVNLGTILIATMFSVLPALRAALLHPVQALRYE